MHRNCKIIDLHHHLVLNNIQNFAAEHSGYILLFKESDCKKLREISVCLYAKNDHYASKCTVANIAAYTKSDESLCQISTQTTEKMLKF